MSVGGGSASRSELQNNGLCLTAVVVCLADLRSKCLAPTMRVWHPGRWGSLRMEDQCGGLFENQKTAAVRLSQNVLQDPSPVGASVVKVVGRSDRTKVGQ